MSPQWIIPVSPGEYSYGTVVAAFCLPLELPGNNDRIKKAGIRERNKTPCLCGS